MKKYREFIGKYNESLHGACLSAGLLLLADSFWVLHWSPMLLSGGAVLFSLLFHYAVKKNAVLPAGSGQWNNGASYAGSARKPYRFRLLFPAP